MWKQEGQEAQENKNGTQTARKLKKKKLDQKVSFPPAIERGEEK